MAERLLLFRQLAGSGGVARVNSAETPSGPAGAFLTFVENYAPLAYGKGKTIPYLEGLEQTWRAYSEMGIFESLNLVPMTRTEIIGKLGIAQSSLASRLSSLASAWRSKYSESHQNPFEPLSYEPSQSFLSNNNRKYPPDGIQILILDYLARGRESSELLHLASILGLGEALEVMRKWLTIEQMIEKYGYTTFDVSRELEKLRDQQVFIPGGIKLRERQNGTGNNNDQRTFSPAGVKLIRKRLDK